jgi:dolichol-phosphate mannosyltransferase
MLLGLSRARGAAIVTMDGDLQNDAADIPKLLEALDGWDAVCGYRAKRRDSLSRRLGSRLAYVVRNWVTHDGARDTGCSLKAFRRECVADLPMVDGVHRFMPAYFRMNRRSIRQVPVNHRPRELGVSKYTNLKRLGKTTFDLVGFSWYRSRKLPPLSDEDIQFAGN